MKKIEPKLLLFLLCITLCMGVGIRNAESLNNQQIHANTDSLKVWQYATCKLPGKFMTAQEIAVVNYLNIARMYPLWFIHIADLHHPQTANEYSLISTLKKMKTARQPLQTDSIQWLSARCHAIEAGKKGIIGHERIQGCKAAFHGECCDYGNQDPLAIVKSLLIDEGVPNLGHRIICIDTQYTTIGVSIQSHIKYTTVAVLDFSYDE